MKPYSFIMGVSLALALSGCGPAYRAVILLDPATQVKIPSSTVLVQGPEGKVVFQYNSSQMDANRGALLFMIIDAAVNSAREKKADKVGDPIEKVLSDINLTDEIKKRLDGKITQIAWIGATGVESGPATAFEAAKKDGAKSFVRVVVIPSISPNFSTLDFTLLLEVYQEASIPNPSNREPVYRWTWNGTIAEVDGGGDMGKNAALWLAEDGKVIRNAYVKGIETVIEKIQIALEDPTAPPS